jgi:hypothetical protein
MFNDENCNLVLIYLKKNFNDFFQLTVSSPISQITMVRILTFAIFQLGQLERIISVIFYYWPVACSIKVL